MIPVAVLLVTAVVGGGGSDACRSGDQASRDLGVSGVGWTTSCRLAGQRRLVAGVRGPRGGSTDAEVAAAVVAGDGSTARAEFLLHGREAEAIREVVQTAEKWAVAIRSEGSLTRVTVLVTSGEDLFGSQEIVTFLRRDGAVLVPIWMGLGSRVERKFDACLVETTVTFRIAPTRGLERSTSTKATFRNAGLDRATAAVLREECVAPPKKKEVFALDRVPIR